MSRCSPATLITVARSDRTGMCHTPMKTPVVYVACFPCHGDLRMLVACWSRDLLPPFGPRLDNPRAFESPEADQHLRTVSSFMLGQV